MQHAYWLTEIRGNRFRLAEMKSGAAMSRLSLSSARHGRGVGIGSRVLDWSYSSFKCRKDVVAVPGELAAVQPQQLLPSKSLLQEPHCLLRAGKRILLPLLA